MSVDVSTATPPFSVQVNFNEPTSFIQRMVENFLYGSLLDKAAEAETTLEEMTYVIAFSISCYAGINFRLNKSFNPLLGETYECDRRVEFGWRCFLEQVRKGGVDAGKSIDHMIT